MTYEHIFAARRCKQLFPQLQYAQAIIAVYSHNCMEVIIHKNHVCCFLTHICAILSHCNTNISLLEGYTVVHTITSHSNNDTTALESLPQTDTVFTEIPTE